MSGSEWDDAEDDYPAAPIPPHERVWRHPSELSPMVMPVSARPLGRSSLVGAGVVGIALMAGLVQLLLPSSGGSGVATEGTSAINSTAAALRNSSTSGQLRQQSTTTPHATQTPVTAAPSPSSGFLAASAVPTMVLMTGDKQAAIAIGDGRRALTTAGGLAENDALTVRLDDGTSVEAVVVKVDAQANVAVLELTEPSDNAARDLAQVEPHDGDVVFVGASDPCGGVLQATADGLVVKMSQVADEGAPVMDQDGALVGLASTDGDGNVRLIPIAQAIVVAYASDVQVVDVWLGVAFEAEGMVVEQVQADSPAALAGVQPSDLLLGIDGTDVADVDSLWEMLADYEPGDVVTLLVDRAGEMVEVSVTLAARPS